MFFNMNLAITFDFFISQLFVTSSKILTPFLIHYPLHYLQNNRCYFNQTLTVSNKNLLPTLKILSKTSVSQVLLSNHFLSFLYIF